MPRRRRSMQQSAELNSLNESITATPAPIPPPPFDMSQLLQTITAAASATQQPQSPKPFKAPSYSGTGDIDLFISQFQEVAEANRWSEPEAKLHLKLNLSGPATSCVDGTTTEEIFSNLQSRFGLTIRQAKEKLRSIRRSGSQDLHELGTEILRLTKLAYPNLSHIDQTDMALDAFTRSLDNVNLQRHFLATQPATLRQAIQSAEEFFQLGRDHKPPRINSIQEEATTPTTPPDLLHECNAQLKQIIELLTKQLNPQPPTFPPFRPPSQNPQQNQPQPRPANRPPLACYECQGPHLRRNCPQVQPRSQQPAGNSQGPAQ